MNFVSRKGKSFKYPSMDIGDILKFSIKGTTRRLKDIGIIMNQELTQAIASKVQLFPSIKQKEI